ncbi:MAG: hypothetical protein SPI60_05800 [Campylobacter lanienae]|nr:hypothetical protein [Campylobacter lanienae]
MRSKITLLAKFRDINQLISLEIMKNIEILEFNFTAKNQRFIERLKAILNAKGFNSKSYIKSKNSKLFNDHNLMLEISTKNINEIAKVINENIH